MDRPEPSLANASEGAPRSTSRRFFWHMLGLLLAAAVAWLVLLAYRQPDLMLELSNLRLC